MAGLNIAALMRVESPILDLIACWVCGGSVGIVS